MEINTSERVYSTEYEVPFYDADYLERMKPSAILKAFSQIAGEDYIDRGMTHHFLEEYGMAFLVSKVAIKVHKYPSHEDRIKVSTWECGKKGVRFIRGYEMRNEAGELLIDGEGYWICVDMQKRSVLRPSQFKWICPQLDKQPSVHIQRIKQSESFEHIADHKLKFSELDSNGHLYNANYGNVITDILSQEEYERGISFLQIDFNHEATIGDTIKLSRGMTDGFIQITGTVDGNSCFDSIMKLKD